MLTSAGVSLEAARAAFRRHLWAEAQAGFVAARDESPLAPADLASLAECLWWQGAIDECLATYEDAYELYVDADPPDKRPAAMLAMEIGFFWHIRGESALASGWLSRAQRLLDSEPECVEQGYLLSMGVGEKIAGGDLDAAIAMAQAVTALASKYHDQTLMALGLVDEGVARIRQGDVAGGLSALDEAMLPVLAGRVDPSHAGAIYCELMSVCYELSDFRRAHQWTEATAKWCEGFSHAVVFLGICRVHRAQLMKLRGDWTRAEDEAQKVCEDLAAMNVVAVSLSWYELGDLHRLRGDLDRAEDAYGHAHRLGRDPQPGWSLLQLARGRTEAALDSIRSGVRATEDRLALGQLWSAEVEIALAAGDLDDARQAAAELDAVARDYGSTGLLAAAAHARGAVLAADGEPSLAIGHLQEAARRWQELDARYRVAQVRVLLGRSHRALGNTHAANLELDAAAAAFNRLGASVDAAHLEADRSGTPLPDGLTAREVEVLALVATGSTNRDVAEALFLSQKTVARHLSNIYTKLDISSRTAAAAYAFDHGLASAQRG